MDTSLQWILAYNGYYTILRHISQWVSKLWSDIQTNKHREQYRWRKWKLNELYPIYRYLVKKYGYPVGVGKVVYDPNFAIRSHHF